MADQRRLRRLLSSVRTRFALAYATLLAGTGLALIALFYAYVNIAGFVQPGTMATPATGAVDAPAVDTSVPADPIVANIAFISAALLLVLVAMWVGWLLAGRLLRPLHAIHHTAQRVGHGDMSARAPLAGPDDEFAQLARVFNDMLDRIQQSLDTHRRFAANASHELRTPLTTNKALLALALDRPDETDVLELATRLHTVNQHSIDTVEALLDLADAQQVIPEREIVDLAELAREQISVAEIEATPKHVGITPALGTARALGSRVLLSRAIANVLQNAVRHNVADGTVTVTTGTGNDGAYIQVTNTGPAVPESIVPTLVEPFIRQRGRAADISEGDLGLGLAIVAAIAGAHGATLELHPRPGGGLTVTFALPPVSAPLDAERQTRHPETV